ncbi:jg11248 [Pararge aegeria aegeria]|uniref:Jg11248 protein n=1 Tax=Pararge aegeria aegeria TaxID=348720 RepID=A0A8S4RL79_9NEOP|nr:jg11248 [Pararge aegeria aegeria]
MHTAGRLNQMTKIFSFFFGWTLADNHLRGCYGVLRSGASVRARHEKSPRARRHQGEGGRRRPEDLDSARFDVNTFFECGGLLD